MGSFEKARTAVLELSQPGGPRADRLQGVPFAELRQTWEIWRRSRLAEAKENFQAWLRQCGQLCEVAQDTEAQGGRGPGFDALCEKLCIDPHYRRLDAIPNERRRLIVARLQEAAASREDARGIAERDDSD